MVWELYLLYPMFRLPRIAYVVDKTIAHTNLDNIIKPYNNDKTDIYHKCGAIVLIFTTYLKACEEFKHRR